MKFSNDLKVECVIAILSLICCFMLLTLNIVFTFKSRTSGLKSDIVHVVGIISTVCCILSNVWMVIGYNNWIYVNKNSIIILTFMQHCDIGFRLNFVAIILSIYGFIIFILIQIINLSHHLPLKYQIKSKSYTLLTIILIFIAFVFCLYLMYDRQALSFESVEAADDIQYKYCFFPMSSQHFFQRFIVVTMSCMTITTTCIFFGGFILYKRINNILSDENILDINKKEIKKVLYDIAAFTILLLMFFVTHRSLKKSFPSSYTITLFPQLISFTISMFITSNLYRNYKHELHEVNQIRLLNEHLSMIPMHSISSNSVTGEIDDSYSASNDSNSCDLVYKYQNGLQFMLADKYINDARRIFTILNDVKYMNEVGHGTAVYHILQEIAAFAATEYEPCLSCATYLPLVECDKDYNMEFGFLSMLDEYQNTKYYINQHNGSIELLCRLCAIKHGVLSNFLLFPTLTRTFQTLRADAQ